MRLALTSAPVALAMPSGVVLCRSCWLGPQNPGSLPLEAALSLAAGAGTTCPYLVCVQPSGSHTAGRTKPPCEKPRRHPGLEHRLLQDKHKRRVGPGTGHGALGLSGPARSRGGEEHDLETSSRTASVGWGAGIRSEGPRPTSGEPVKA